MAPVTRHKHNYNLLQTEVNRSFFSHKRTVPKTCYYELRTSLTGRTKILIIKTNEEVSVILCQQNTRMPYVNVMRIFEVLKEEKLEASEGPNDQ